MSKANRAKRERRPAPPSPRPTGSISRLGVGVGIAIVLAVGVALGIFALTNHSSSAPAAGAQLTGLQAGPGPWNPETAGLTQRLGETGVPFSNMAATALHIHPQLKLEVRGKQIPVPANIGISSGDQTMAALHTHDESGTVHVESPVVRKYTLGEFFDVWGVRLTTQCLGGNCANADNKLAAFVDGKRYSGDPRTIEFADGERILLAFGTSAEVARVKPSFG